MTLTRVGGHLENRRRRSPPSWPISIGVYSLVFYNRRLPNGENTGRGSRRRSASRISRRRLVDLPLPVLEARRRGGGDDRSAVVKHHVCLAYRRL